MRIVTLSQLSLAGSSGIAEVKQPIWFADGTRVGQTSSTTSGTYFLQDGGGITNSTGSAAKIFTLSSSWNSTQKFAFEATFDNNGGGGGNTASVALWDFTSGGAIVATSQVSTTSGTSTVVRSSQFTLTPGHTYGVTAWFTSSSVGVYISDASLIIFP